MPGMQFLGTAPTRRSQVAQAMAGGMAGFAAGKEKRETRELELEKIDYGKKKDMYNMLLKRAEMLGDSEASTRLFSSDMWQELENNLGIPHIVDLEEGKPTKPVKFKGKEGKPTWGQKESMKGVEADIRRKRGVVSDVVGQMIPYEMKTREEALDYISRKKLDPTRFKKIIDEVYGSTGTNGGYSKMTEAQLYNKAMAGDRGAIAEAARRGYPVGR